MTSSTRSILLDFRDYSASDVSRRGKSKKDEEDDLVSDYLGMDVSPGINTVVQPPQSYKLPCDHPYAVDFLSETESELPDAWKLIWRDDLLFEELGPFDAEVLVQQVGANQFIETRDSGFTIHGCCGHISKGEDFQ